MDSVDDYDYIEAIGRGGFGIVLRARHKKLNKLFAIKVFKGDSRRERDMMRMVGQHPMIVDFKASWAVGDYIFLVLEYASCGTFAEEGKRRHWIYHLQPTEGPKSPPVPLKQEDARFYIAEIILAIEHIHSQGIIYRDLKPDNILFDGTGHVKICDFGLSFHIRERSTEPVGAIGYRAPEMIHPQSAIIVEDLDLFSTGSRGSSGSASSSGSPQLSESYLARLGSPSPQLNLGPGILKRSGSLHEDQSSRLSGDLSHLNTQNAAGGQSPFLWKSRTISNMHATLPHVERPSPSRMNSSKRGLKKYKYGTSIDLWNLGLVSAIMLTGVHPFVSEELDEMRKPYKPYKGISDAANDFLQKLLTFDVDERMTLHEAKDHPFFEDFDWTACEQRKMTPPKMNQTPRDSLRTTCRWKNFDEVYDYIDKRLG